MQKDFKQEDFYPDYYQRLGVASNATATEITRAYKKRAMETHPDRNMDDRENATKQFVSIGRAYEVLKEPDTKRSYDKALASYKLGNATQDYDRNSAKSDFTKPEFYADVRYTEEEVKRYYEAQSRLASGNYRSGDLSTVFNFVAKPPENAKPKLEAFPMLKFQ